MHAIAIIMLLVAMWQGTGRVTLHGGNPPRHLPVNFQQ